MNAFPRQKPELEVKGPFAAPGDLFVERTTPNPEVQAEIIKFRKEMYNDDGPIAADWFVLNGDLNEHRSKFFDRYGFYPWDEQERLDKAA